LALWVVATPIGTLADLSPRAREVLGTAALVVAEDTRTTRRLLSAVDVPAPPLRALHSHNEQAVADEVAARALVEEVALVSDAGTPGISDPGSRVVSAVLACGGEVRSVPGPSALVAALAASGLASVPSTFVGFPPRKGRARWCRDALASPGVVVAYESPRRVVDLLAALAAVCPEREAAVCRELSKRHEEVDRGTLGALHTRWSARAEVRGECVVVVGAGQPPAEEVSVAVDEGAGVKDVSAALAVRWGVPRKEVYRALLDLERAVKGS
jgi:16S rRNA (cytidine1402-2'-O)-methyltransferase